MSKAVARESKSPPGCLVAKAKPKLRKVRTGKSRGRRFDCRKLQKPEVQKKFAIKLANRFDALKKEAEMAINEFNCVLRKTGKVILGYRKKRREEWLVKQLGSKLQGGEKIRREC